MKSPTAFLFNHAHKPLSALSDEMRQKLIDTGLKLTLRYIETDELRCDFDPATDEITVSTRFVEMLWITSYVNAIYFDLVRKKGGLTGSVEIDPQEEPELHAAMELSHWMLKSILDPTKSKTWPIGLPRPNENATRESWENVADEMTLTAIGFILLHEVAHAYRGHKRSHVTTENIRQENEADRYAREWYFADHPDAKSNDRIKRGLGVASALITLVALGMFDGNFSSSTHPPSHERLKEVLTSIESDPAHPVFAFVAQLLPLYASMAGGAFADEPSADYRDAFNRFIAELSQTFPPRT